MLIEPQTIHLWTIELDAPIDDQELAWLSPEEKARAEQLRIPKTKQRFIVARCKLRQLLSFYLSTDPKAIQFDYGLHGKPHLSPASSLAFNLSHSNNTAAYAFTMDHAIGVDIEKIRNHFKHDVAQRFFSAQENFALSQLSEEEQINAFYFIWSRKEALIKAIGKGVFIPIADFSVSLQDEPQLLSLEGSQWQLIPLFIKLGYQASVATNQLVKKIDYWKLVNQEGVLDKIYYL